MKNIFYTKIGQYLASHGGGAFLKDLNKLHVKPVVYDMDNEEQRNEFNDIYQTLIMSSLDKIIRTPSGGISKCRHNKRGVWDIQNYQTQSIITAVVEGTTFCYKIKTKDKSNTVNMSGTLAFRIFKEKCLEQGIDIDSYKIENGVEVKDTIISPKISMKYKRDSSQEGLTNVHHVDFHNSYPAGLCNTHPEFRPVIEPIYEGRKNNPENKLVLNCTIGYMQMIEKNKRITAKWAHLAKDAIEDNNKRVDELASRLEAAGREVIGYNTDGIWYRGEIYHGAGEGTKLGEWSNDHVNCIFRAKSDGAYEFIEDDKYYPVVRGRTKLDEITPRESWHWGDIYQTGNTIRYTLKPFEGIVPVEVEDEE